MKKTVTIIIVMILTVLMGACSSSSSYQNVSVEEAHNLIEDGKVSVIDVRTQAEYDAGHIPQAKLLPLQQIDSWYKALNKDESYLIVCRSGNRSGQASDFLAKKGLNNVYNMTGGMNEWSYEVTK